LKICVGISNVNSVEKYIKAGADEFYCGVIDKSWVSKYGYILGINRRPWPSTNLSGFGELEAVVNKAHKYGSKVFFTINEHCYSNEQLEIIEYHVKKSLECKVDAIIFSDPGLIKLFYDKYKCSIHLSTGGTVFNQWTAKFYRDELNVERIIMPREVTIDEIRSISNTIIDIEYEVFILNEGCINIDGFCNHMHGLTYVSENGKLQNHLYSVGCMYRYALLNGKINGEIIDSNYDINEKLNEAVRKCGTCGACAVYYFKNMKISSLKLVGRATDEAKIINDIKFLKESIDLCSKVKNFKEFHNIIANKRCMRAGVVNSKEACYYPDILRMSKNV